jgi:HEAT repeat protein
MADVVRSALLDRAARVRGLARVLVVEHGLAVVPRDIYIQLLTRATTSGLAVAVEGVGETGTRADLALIAPFLYSSSARVRRATLRAAALLDVDTAISSAIAAFVDEARSIRTMATRILRGHASRVDFDTVSRRLQALTDPTARRMLLPLLGAAPKWDAVANLLQALTDPHEEVRRVASTLLIPGSRTSIAIKSRRSLSNCFTSAACSPSSAASCPRRLQSSCDSASDRSKRGHDQRRAPKRPV